MPVCAIVGANWGDEGKGKIVDYLAADVDWVVRFQGGANAGHTVINPFGKFVMHLLPSGIFRDRVVNVIGPGVAVDCSALTHELELLEKAQVPQPLVFISERAQVVLPYHIEFDQYEEDRLGGKCFGSTRKGIAPFYADKYFKLGVQVADLGHRDRLLQRIADSLIQKNVLLEHLYHKPKLDVERVTAAVLESAERILPLVRDTTTMLLEAIERDERILLEGQLGALRDPDQGIYPFVTSSSPLAGSASAGAGIPPWSITEIVAVTKAYSTCVGAGPFVAEIFGQQADALRLCGGDAGEFGATTGRPRRMGWFDAVATRYGCRLQGATAVALTNLDVLGYLDRIPICTAYRIGEQPLAAFPAPARLEHAVPVYEQLNGWQKDISGVRSFTDLPVEARNYVRRIEKLIGVPIRWISVGPQREAIFQVGM